MGKKNKANEGSACNHFSFSNNTFERCVLQGVQTHRICMVVDCCSVHTIQEQTSQLEHKLTLNPFPNNKI